MKVNLLNFMATSEGLQDQMLGKVVAIEQKELELTRQQLIIEDAENQKQLKEIEDKILHMLKNAEGNILDDEVLIDTLADSKKTSNIITEKVKIADQTQARIAKVRQGYVPVAYLSSQLFSIISDLSIIDPMYQYSLDWYIKLYEQSIDLAEKSKVLEERLKNLNDCFTYLLYKNVCRSLFEKDKLLFSFLLTTKILIGRKLLDSSELRFLLQGNTGFTSEEPNPYLSWLPDKSWNDILAMISGDLPSFPCNKEVGLKSSVFYQHFQSNIHQWNELMISNDPCAYLREFIVSSVVPASPAASSAQAALTSPMSSPTGSNAANNANSSINNSVDFTPFQRLCILRCLRPDVMIPAIQEFIANEMGSKFIEPPSVLIKECYEDSVCYTPIIFVLTPGAAPMTELYKLADDLGYSNKLLAISLGQGQVYLLAIVVFPYNQVVFHCRVLLLKTLYKKRPKRAVGCACKTATCVFLGCLR